MLAYNCGHFVDTLSPADAGDRHGARVGRKIPPLATTGSRKQIKNNTNEASMLMKTHGGISRTKLKRTHIECRMRVPNAQFELFHTAHVLFGGWSGGIASGRGIVRSAEIRRCPRNYKNSGNEAKKSLKTNHITFLMLQITRN